MKPIIFVGVLLLMFTPVQAYACTGGGNFLEYLGFNSLFLSIWFLLLLAFKGLLYRIKLREPVFLRILKAGIVPLITGILLSSVYGTFHGKILSIDRIVSQVTFIVVMTIVTFLLLHFADRKLFSSAKLELLGVQRPINLLIAILFSVGMTGELQCSSQSSISKINASSIQMDNVSVFE